MKQLQKYFFGVFLSVLLVVSPVAAFAEVDLEPTPVLITSGLPSDPDRLISTFRATRVVYGEAEPDTNITVRVYQEDVHGDFEEIAFEETQVGVLGIFSITVPLEEGYNYVTVTAELEGYDEAVSEAVIKRLPEKIKDELQRVIALPPGIAK